MGHGFFRLGQKARDVDLDGTVSIGAELCCVLDDLHIFHLGFDENISNHLTRLSKGSLGLSVQSNCHPCGIAEG